MQERLTKLRRGEAGQSIVVARDANGSTQQGRGAVTSIDHVCLVIDLRRHVLRETLGEAL